MIELFNSLFQMTTNISEEVILNIPRAYTAMAEWLACLIFIIFSQKRFKKSYSILLVVAFLVVLIIYQYLAGLMPLYLWIPGMIISVCLMFIFIFCLTRISLIRTAYFTVHAFVIAEFVASIEWQLYYYFILNIWKENSFWMSIIWVVVIYGILFVSMYLLERRYQKYIPLGDLKKNDLINAILIAVVVFTISNVSFISINTPFSGNKPTDIFYIRTLVDLSGVILFYTQREHKFAIYSKLEVSAMQHLLEKQYVQYYQYQENIEVVNRQYHDLKHQINVIRLETDSSKREQYLKELETSIIPFETKYKTGNHVLDIMITSKSMICFENHISFTCVADGSLLGFISEMELCSIFGNALDNAIESSKKLKDLDKRIIKVKVYSQNQFIIIRFENYYDSEIIYQNGSLITTKHQSYGHGYGIKSIKSIIEKYDGTMNIITENNWFTLTILFPITSQNQ